MVIFSVAVVFALTGRVPKKRVKWCSKLEHEYINNYKILQDVFKKLGVEQVRVDLRNWISYRQLGTILFNFLPHLLVERQFFMVHFHYIGVMNH